MRATEFIAAAAAAGSLAACEEAARAQDVPLEPEAWSSEGAELAFQDHLGRPAMRIENGGVVMDGVELENGVIAFDIAFDEIRSFTGLVFRRSGDGDGEYFYFRPHQSGQPDANQYTPLFNGSSAWQIYYGPRYSTPTQYHFAEWMRVEVVVRGDEAEIRLDGEPILHIADLLRDSEGRSVALSAYLQPVWISNVRVSEDAPAFALAPEAAPAPPAGAIMEWEVSEPFDWSEVADVSQLDPTWVGNLGWTSLSVERNGVANLARVADPDDGDTVLARVTVSAEQADELRFGFSDSVRAYVDGELAYAGDNTYRSRDHRYLGTVGLFDTVFADPAGEPVTFTFAVREAFGGWAVAGATAAEQVGP